MAGSLLSRSDYPLEDGLPAARQRIQERISQVRILDLVQAQALIRVRQEQGLDSYDEVWNGVYIVPPLANNPHQNLVGLLTAILYEVIVLPGQGLVQPGVNVSDRRAGWEDNYRVPDLVVVRKGSRAVDCTTHWCGGPDFLIEIESPGDETEEKLPFYSAVGVQELLIIHRDTRELRLYRHDGDQLVGVGPSVGRGKKGLASAVVPLAFRRWSRRGVPRTEEWRTDRKRGKWIV